jgi:hypothetical protein
MLHTWQLDPERPEPHMKVVYGYKFRSGRHRRSLRLRASANFHLPVGE